MVSKTKLTQLYVADYRETKSIARSRKKKIIVYIYILMAISIYLVWILGVKIGPWRADSIYYLPSILGDSG